MNSPTTELLLPAGGLEAGVAAFEGGADAVYLGFTEFSARKAARNFDRDGYRRILALARSTGRRIYVAINTVILEDELVPAVGLLAFLERFPPDAVIIQDWGLARLIRAGFPGLVLHASTQTAVQGLGAARLAKELGATRLVLPRETTIAELAALHAALPELEYEVFAHGALCYSFSGLCLASGRLLGRSGNRGECAQVCRSYYRAESGPGVAGKSGYWFSCRDLSLEDELAPLVAAGAASLKIEGRMKSPEYAYAVARLYRGALDRLAGKPDAPSAEELELRREAARIAFARSPTRAYSRVPSGESLIDARYPGHLGVPAGRILKAERGRALLELASPLGLRDGLLALVPGEDPDALPEALAFGVTEIADAASGRRLVHAVSGGRVEIAAPLALRPGLELHRVSAREFDRRALSPDAYPFAVERIPGRLSIVPEAAPMGNAEAAGAAPRGRIRLELEPARGSALVLLDEETLGLERGKNPGGFRKSLALFAESGDADFRLELEFAPEALRLGSESIALADLFVPPSLLKKAKNRLYERASAALVAAERERAAAALDPEPRGAAGHASPASPSAGAAVPGAPLGAPVVPPRGFLVFPHPELPSGQPFATPRLLAEGAALPEFAGIPYLPLAPLVADPAAYEKLVEERVRTELASGASLVVGLGGLHHAALARRLASLFPEGRLSFFGDIHLYVANRHALAAWASIVPRLAFAYHYLETSPANLAAILADLQAADLAPETGRGLPLLAGLEGSPAVAGAPAFEPPLFLSKACLLRHHAAGGACPEPCGKRWSARLADRDRRYLAFVEDCISHLFRLP
ncbi:MAG: U32 family peptidase [Spirochaetaceae bacterium]|nr:U32 family peptidase [Spirochaetaceae bacterium]